MFRGPHRPPRPERGPRQRPFSPACSGWGRPAWTLGDPAPTAAGSPGPARTPTRMEILDEFDNEFPQSVTFCRRISEEAFERQAATCTERALRRLFRSLDHNPALAERVVRKGKQAECERRGLLSFLWVRDAGGLRRVGWKSLGGESCCPLGRNSGLGARGLQSWVFQELGECGQAARRSSLLPPAQPLPLLSQAKFFCAVQGEMNFCNSMGALEMHQRLEHLKRSIHRVHLYSHSEAQSLPPSNPAH